MEGEVELISFERVKELKGELVEACKKAEVERLREKRFESEGGADDKQQEVKLEMGRKAEEIIPKECWALLLQNLDEEDLLRCRQVCKTFKHLLDLKEFKVKWKFKFVLPHLFPYLKTISPNGSPSWKHLSNPRLVCRFWRRAIDKYTSEVHGRESCFLPTNELPLLTRFRTSEDIQEFQQKFGESTNPFPSRSVCILNPVEELVEEDPEDQMRYYQVQLRLQKAYVEKVGEFLEQFGTHIIRLRLCFGYEHICGPTSLSLCKLLGRVLIHLPNLKELFIRNQPCVNCDKENGEVVGINSAAPKLEALSIYRGKKVEDYLLTAFASQLTQLDMDFSKNHPTQLQMEELKNLRKLSISLDDPNDALESLRLLQSPLQLLKVVCRFEPAQVSLNLDKVLKNVKHLPIEELDLKILSRGQGRNVVEAGLDIEEYKNDTIKKLTIHIIRANHVDGQQLSFNFLQAMTKLERLEFKFSGEQVRTFHPEGVVEEVKLNEYLFGEGEARMHQSNVWEKVGNLKTLVFLREEEVVFVKSIFTRVKPGQM